MGKTRSKRVRLYEKAMKDGVPSCFYCGGPMTWKRGSSRATLDHIVPKSMGGTMADSNLVLCHFACNQALGNRPAAHKLLIAGFMRYGKAPW